MNYTRTGTSIWGDLIDVKLAVNNNDAGNYEMGKKCSDGNAKTTGKTSMMTHTFGDIGGSDLRNQTIQEMPMHSHDITISAHVDGASGESGGAWGSYAHNPTSTAGNSYGMGIMPPYYVLTYIMKL